MRPPGRRADRDDRRVVLVREAPVEHRGDHRLARRVRITGHQRGDLAGLQRAVDPVGHHQHPVARQKRQPPVRAIDPRDGQRAERARQAIALTIGQRVLAPDVAGGGAPQQLDPVGVVEGHLEQPAVAQQRDAGVADADPVQRRVPDERGGQRRAGVLGVRVPSDRDDDGVGGVERTAQHRRRGLVGLRRAERVEEGRRGRGARLAAAAVTAHAVADHAQGTEPSDRRLAEVGEAERILLRLAGAPVLRVAGGDHRVGRGSAPTHASPTPARADQVKRPSHSGTNMSSVSPSSIRSPAVIVTGVTTSSPFR